MNETTGKRRAMVAVAGTGAERRRCERRHGGRRAGDCRLERRNSGHGGAPPCLFVATFAAQVIGQHLALGRGEAKAPDSQGRESAAEAYRKSAEAFPGND